MDELKQNLEILMQQWNEINAKDMDPFKKSLHLSKLENWVTIIQYRIEAMEAHKEAV